MSLLTSGHLIWYIHTNYSHIEVIRLIAVALAMLVATPSPSPTSSADYQAALQRAAVTVTVPGVPHELGLDESIDVAAAMSPVLAEARAALHISQAAVLQAGVPLAPTLAGNLLYADGTSSSQFVNQKGVGVTLNQLVYDGGRVVALVRAARSTGLSASKTFRRQLQTLVNNVAQAYFTALQASDQVRVQREIVQQDLTQERLVSAQITAGLAARIDLETAQIPTLQDRGAVVRAEGQELSSLSAFASVLGLRPDADVRPKKASATSANLEALHVPFAYNQAMELALSSRPDFLAAAFAVDAADQNLRAARANRYPSVLVSLNAGSVSEYIGAPFQSANGATANISVPVFDGGLTAAAVATARAQLEQAQAQHEVAMNIVQTDVRQSLVQLLAAQGVVEEASRQLSKARDVAAGTQLQYSAGQTTLPLLLNAQTQRASAQTNFASASYSFLEAEQTYLYALGANDRQDGLTYGSR